MTIAERARLEAALEGVPLPAAKEELVRYATREEPGLTRLLAALPDRRYHAIDEVGEALAPVQPARSNKTSQIPHAESGLPPGGDDYLSPNPTPGAIRPDGPPSARVEG